MTPPRLNPGNARLLLLAGAMALVACTVTPTTPEVTTGTGRVKAGTGKTPKPGATPTGDANGDPTPVGTGTPSPTPTGTGSPSASPTASATASPTTSPTATASATASPTASPTATPQPALTAAPTPAPGTTPGPGALTVGTYAGTGMAGLSSKVGEAGVAASAATFNKPEGLAVDAEGNVFVADTGNHCIRKIANDASHTVTTILGDGTVTTPNDAARLASPRALAIGLDRTLYIADTGNQRIRKLSPDASTSTKYKSLFDFVIGNGGAAYAEGTADLATVFSPAGLAYDDATSTLYFADTGNHCIRKIKSDRSTALVAGLGGPGNAGTADGLGSAARFNAPTGLYLANGLLWVADSNNGLVRKVALSGEVTTAMLDEDTVFNPSFVIGDADGTLTVFDNAAYSVTRFASNGTASTMVAGSEAGFANGGSGTAKFASMGQAVVLPSGTILVADPQNNRIRSITKQ